MGFRARAMAVLGKAKQVPEFRFSRFGDGGLPG